MLPNISPTKSQRDYNPYVDEVSITLHIVHIEITILSYGVALLFQSGSDYEDDLTQWKDRTQAAATTSLSLVQVALLRDVLNGGPDIYRHYISTVTILAVCIALEIVSGFLIITLYMLKSRARALTSINVVQKSTDEDAVDGDMEHNLEDNITTSGRFMRNIYNIACCRCRPGLEDLLQEAIQRKYLQELRLNLKYPNHSDLPDVRNDLVLLRKRRHIMVKFLMQVKMRTTNHIIVRLQTAITYIFYILSLFNIFVVIFGVSKESQS